MSNTLRCLFRTIQFKWQPMLPKTSYNFVLHCKVPTRNLKLLSYSDSFGIRSNFTTLRESKFSLLSVLSQQNACQQKRSLPTLNQTRRQKPRTKRKRPKKVVPLERRILFGPQRKGICVKCVVRTPGKPNSAQRKCAVLRLSNGKMITAYIPGEKSNLQEHGVVLFRGGRVQDCPGLKYKIIRGVFDMN